jgi:anhydro-N-acetylmuramic acid kinase
MSTPSERFFLGLMSGTSLDGLDIALISIAPFKLIETGFYPFDDRLRSHIKNIATNPESPLNKVLAVEQAFTGFCAQSVNQFLTLHRFNPEAIEACGFHGQTIFHAPDQSISFQMGDGGKLAVDTGMPVVADIRRMDVAAGGEGAPLVPAFHQAVFGRPGEQVAVVNIGGIANLSLLGRHGQCSGFDTGPGNTLINDLMEKFTGIPMDAAGALAATGIVRHDLLQRALSDTYFSQAVPKSTGREYFSLDWLTAIWGNLDAPGDQANFVATATALTAQTIANAISNEMPDCGRIWVCGGGVHNRTLMRMISDAVAPVPIATTESAGLGADWVEAAAFAWLAAARVDHLQGNVLEVTGANRPLVLGSLYYGRRPKLRC